jgi:hypothetical protein
MTHATRFVAVLVALVLCVPMQAQTPEIDALRLLPEQGDAEAQFNFGVMYVTGQGVPQAHAQAHMWANLAAPGLLARAATGGQDPRPQRRQNDRRAGRGGAAPRTGVEADDRALTLNVPALIGEVRCTDLAISLLL